jgi:hypothetical protein
MRARFILGIYLIGSPLKLHLFFKCRIAANVLLSYLHNLALSENIGLHQTTIDMEDTMSKAIALILSRISS